MRRRRRLRTANQSAPRRSGAGGIAHSIGQVLFNKRCDEDQLLTGEFMDYAMPRATDIPAYIWQHGHAIAGNPLGIKGVGEAGRRRDTGDRQRGDPTTPCRSG
jgi:CO/xanthine dehydrogenase Mo-binding subunit